MVESLCRYWYIWVAPRAQLNPIQNGFAFIIEMKKASVSYPESVRPAASMMVPEMNRGNLGSPVSRKKFM